MVDLNTPRALAGAPIRARLPGDDDAELLGLDVRPLLVGEAEVERRVLDLEPELFGEVPVRESRTLNLSPCYLSLKC